MSVPAPVATSRSGAGQSIRVMVVDDSAVVRGLVSRWLGEEPGIEVVASLRTGREAIDQVERTHPDVVLLDIEMPELDGLSALPLLLEKDRDLIVLMASTLTRPSAEASLKALSLGAADYIPKPQTSRGVTSVEFRRELVDKVRHLGARRGNISARQPGVPEARVARAEVGPRPPVAVVSPAHPLPTSTTITLRPFSRTTPKVLLVGSSTGGPQALNVLMSGLGRIVDRAAVLITQHMPPTFTAILAEHLARASGREAHEAIDREPIAPGHIYIAPGGRHMRVERGSMTPFITLDDGPPINFCRPAVDPLFSSGAAVWGAATLAVVLTGMGSDGARGAGDIVAAGGSVIAQDEATSVVWGMPGSAAHAGVCSAVLPLDQLASRVSRLFAGDHT
jgi:two-component system, chemotaxis family, protein-glutamate methylesterase/glutaminase